MTKRPDTVRVREQADGLEHWAAVLVAHKHKSSAAGIVMLREAAKTLRCFADAPPKVTHGPAGPILENFDEVPLDASPPSVAAPVAWWHWVDHDGNDKFVRGGKFLNFDATALYAHPEDAPGGPEAEYTAIFTEISEALERTANQAKELRSKFDRAFDKIDAMDRLEAGKK